MNEFSRVGIIGGKFVKIVPRTLDDLKFQDYIGSQMQTTRNGENVRLQIG